MSSAGAKGASAGAQAPAAGKAGPPTPQEVLQRAWKGYSQSTPNRLKAVDVYLVFLMITGAVQFLYCLLVGTYPFNSMLAGFISTVGSFVLAVSLRMQVAAPGDSKWTSPEAAFAEFLFCTAIFQIFVVNFLG
ncbi:DAD/Ost2 [Hyaloraphidium curvatum]|nr:DAD/Ost2 [Hyaloraphidium curvatum]